MSVLLTDQLTKKYKGSAAVSGVDMHVEKGDIYGFVGENGAGKTTLIRMVTGLAAPTSGSYSLFGVRNDRKEIHGVRRKTAAIVETATLAKNMTAVDNLKLQCMIVGKTCTEEELSAMIERVGLDSRAIAKKKVANFSLGMRQRLGIAMVMVSEPEFVVLDEPMNGLDPQGFIEVRETILKLNREGVTFLISSHILAELEKVCTKIGFISHGRLLEEITMEDLHKKARRRIAITAEEPEKVRALLSSSGAFPEIEQNDREVLVYGDADINAVMRILVENAVPVLRITTVEETVEDYYVQLLGKGRTV